MDYISDYSLREKGCKFIYGKRTGKNNNFHYAASRNNKNTSKESSFNLQ